MTANKFLKEEFLKHTQKVSDKWSSYVEAWDTIFDPYRKSPINLFEIGVQNGGSLEVWAKYFKNAKNIVGCDIDERCKILSFDDPRIALFVGDANSDEIKEKVLETAPKYDIIIDDGSHMSSDVILSFSKYFASLEIGGTYLVEDLHASYWQDYEGGLFDPSTSMSFFKHLADIINHEHWRNNQSRVDFLSGFSAILNTSFSEDDLMSIHSIEFLNSVCILKKRRPDENVLGKRIVVGTEELVTDGMLKLDGMHIQDFTVAIKGDSDLEPWKLIKELESENHSIESLNMELVEKKRSIGSLKKNLEEVKGVTKALRESLLERDKALDKLRVDLAVRDESLGKLTVDHVERSHALEKLTFDLAECDQTLKKLAVDLAKRDQALKKLTGDLAERDQALKKLTGDLAERDQTLERLKVTLTESQKELVRHVQSTSWKITKPIRKIGKLLNGKNKNPDTSN